MASSVSTFTIYGYVYGLMSCIQSSNYSPLTATIIMRHKINYLQFMKIIKIITLRMRMRREYWFTETHHVLTVWEINQCSLSVVVDYHVCALTHWTSVWFGTCIGIWLRHWRYVIAEQEVTCKMTAAVVSWPYLIRISVVSTNLTNQLISSVTKTLTLHRPRSLAVMLLSSMRKSYFHQWRRLQFSQEKER